MNYHKNYGNIYIPPRVCRYGDNLDDDTKRTGISELEKVKEIIEIEGCAVIGCGKSTDGNQGEWKEVNIETLSYSQAQMFSRRLVRMLHRRKLYPSETPCLDGAYVTAYTSLGAQEYWVANHPHTDENWKLVQKWADTEAMIERKIAYGIFGVVE